MKKFLCLTLIICFVFLVACNKSDNAVTERLNSAIDAVNSQQTLKCDYMLEISFGSGTVMYYANGNAAWDRENKTVNTFFNQTYLGSSVVMENYFADGKMVSVENGSAITVERDGAVLVTKFPYFNLVKPNENTAVSTGSNIHGDYFSFELENTSELCENLIGGDIYALTTVIKKPQKDKTKYGNTSCVYTVKDNKVLSARYEFTVKLFDTPNGSANYTPPESEYTLELKVVAKVSYTDFGEGVKIEKYSSPDEAK